MPRLLALDHNFPPPILKALDDFIPEAELVAVGDIDERLPRLDDWQLLLALHRHDRPWDGLVTTDSGMLNLPRELAVLLQTKLTLIVAIAAGHDPLKATGLLLANLEGICRRIDPSRAQLWTLRTANKPSEDPWERLRVVASRHGLDASALYERERLTETELAADPLADF